MIAAVKSIDLIDYENWTYCPDDMTDFCVAAEAMIGPAEEEGSEIFSFEVCTPRWFAENRGDRVGFIRAVIFVPKYDERVIKMAVNELVKRTSGSDWADVAQKLCRFLRWEFEDYRP